MPGQKRSLSAPLVALALGVVSTGAGCQGADRISIGAVGAPVFFISPQGSDGASGSQSAPWKTFAPAIARLTPGATLVMLDGVYEKSTTGHPEVRCGGNAANGTAQQPIILRAQNERRAFLRGDGRSPPFVMEDCSYWIVEGLYAASADAADAPDTREFGSVFLIGPNNHHVILRRLLGSHPNRFQHSHGLKIDTGSSNILVEECELYDFYDNGFESVRANNITFRRNHAHARSIADVEGGYGSKDTARGDIGFFAEEPRRVIFENNIAEGVQVGFAVAGRYQFLASDTPYPGTDPLDGNRLLGNVAVQPAGSGFLLLTSCNGQSPCDDRARVLAGTELTDNVSIGGATGLSVVGTVGTRISQFTAIGAGTGVALERTAINVGVKPTSFMFNSLVVNFATAGFSSVDQTEWGFDHCAAVGGAGAAFVPLDAHVTSVVPFDPGLGGCLVYLPAGSPLRQAGVGARAVGANVLDRYTDGLLGNQRLWDPTTGAFPCGATVAGVNDDPATGCIGVHQRLAVAQADCPLP